jgi:hypothetical protein
VGLIREQQESFVLGAWKPENWTKAFGTREDLCLSPWRARKNCLAYGFSGRAGEPRNPFSSGEEELSVSRLIRLSGRVYDPLLARFTNTTMENPRQHPGLEPLPPGPVAAEVVPME